MCHKSVKNTKFVVTNGISQAQNYQNPFLAVSVQDPLELVGWGMDGTLLPFSSLLTPSACQVHAL